MNLNHYLGRKLKHLLLAIQSRRREVLGSHNAHIPVGNVSHLPLGLGRRGIRFVQLGEGLGSDIDPFLLIVGGHLF